LGHTSTFNKKLTVLGAHPNPRAKPNLREKGFIFCQPKLDPKRKRLFVIDGSKALRAAIDAVFGSRNPVQCCRRHKIENLMGYLPEHVKGQVKAALRAAFRLPAGGRDGAAGEASAVARARASGRGGEFAGKDWRRCSP
jgi:hypothetical protein